MLKTQLFGGIIILRDDKKIISSFQTAQNIWTKKWKVHDFSRPGKCIFKLHDFSRPFESCYIIRPRQVLITTNLVWYTTSVVEKASQ